MISSRRVFLSSAAATAVAATLAACSDDLPGAPSVSGTPSAQPVLDSDRLAAILARIQTGLDAADAQKSKDALTGYLTGPAARMREYEYTIASATGDDSRIHTFTTASKAGSVGLTSAFPRTAMTLTEVAQGDTAEYLLALTQDSARDDFVLWGWVRLYGEATVPETIAASVGAEQIDAESTGLVATPQQVLDAYVDALNNPDGDNGKAFADDTIRQRIAGERAVDLGGMGEVTVTASAGSDGFKGLRAYEGGALVMTTLKWDQVLRNTTAGSTITVSDVAVSALMGEDKKVVGTVTISYEAIVAFSIPPEGADTGAVSVGSDLVITSVTRDDSQAPAAEN